MALISFSERFGMISAVTMNQVRKTICNQYILTQLSATQLQRLQKTYVMAKRLQGLYLKREFEVALNQRFLRCGCILFFGHQQGYTKYDVNRSLYRMKFKQGVKAPKSKGLSCKII